MDGNHLARAQLLSLEAAIYQLPRVELPLTHHFAPGVYMREMFIPAGTVLSGKIHLTQHFCLLLAGTVSIATDQGDETFIAPCVMRTMPGMKRAIFAHEDSRLMTVHATNETEPEKIEETITTTSYDDPRLECK